MDAIATYDNADQLSVEELIDLENLTDDQLALVGGGQGMTVF